MTSLSWTVETGILDGKRMLQNLGELRTESKATACEGFDPNFRNRS